MSVLRAVLVLAALVGATPAAAQRLPPGAQPQAPASPGPEVLRPTSPAVAVVASALVPGAGQLLQRQSRWVPYLALEVWSWLRYRERRHAYRDLTAQYRDLAWSVARRVGVGERRDTVFEYYEALSHYRSSGAPVQAGLLPEQDTTTFNGYLWYIARSLYCPASQDCAPGSSEFETALGYYQAHGISQHYRWEWGGSSLEQQEFAHLITRSDEAYRDGTRMLGLILANHVASTVDALITSRLQALAAQRAEFRTELYPEGGGARLRSQVRFSF